MMRGIAKRIIFRVFIIVIISFIVTFGISRFTCSGMDFAIFSWVFNVLFTIGGVQLTYSDLIAKRSEADFGFYIGMKTMLKRLEQFLGDKKNWKSADIFWMMLDHKEASESGRLNVNPRTLSNFKEFSKDFFDFICNSKNNAPPDNEGIAWDNCQETLLDFLTWAATCENAEKLSSSYVETYFSNLVISVNALLRKIENRRIIFNNNIASSTNSNNKSSEQ